MCCIDISFETQCNNVNVYNAFNGLASIIEMLLSKVSFSLVPRINMLVSMMSLFNRILDSVP